MPDGSETSSHTHGVEADVRKIRQSRVHDRARFFFSIRSLRTINTYGIPSRKYSLYFYASNNIKCINQLGSNNNNYNNNRRATTHQHSHRIDNNKHSIKQIRQQLDSEHLNQLHLDSEGVTKPQQQCCFIRLLHYLR